MNRAMDSRFRGNDRYGGSEPPRESRRLHSLGLGAQCRDSRVRRRRREEGEARLGERQRTQGRAKPNGLGQGATGAEPRNGRPEKVKDMKATIRIDGNDAISLYPRSGAWGEGAGVEVHPAAEMLSCRLHGGSSPHEVMPWIEHLLPENGHRERSRERARRKLRNEGLEGVILNTGHELWANAHKEYAGKVEAVAYGLQGEEISPRESAYVPVTDEQVGWLVGVAGRVAEGGKAVAEYQEKLREHGLGGGRGKVCLKWNWEMQGWEMPVGKALSTHILKNESAREWLPAEAAMESYCQRALGLAGIQAAWTRCRRYAGISTVVSWRSDRANIPKNVPLQAIHQEEWSQAIGVYPEEEKMQGGPEQEWPGLMRLLGKHGHKPEVEQHKLAKVMAAIVVMGNGDTHRRNIGLQHVWGQEGRKVVLAPLYDCSSVEGIAAGPVKGMELPIGGEHEFDRVGTEHWRRFADASGVRLEMVMDAVREVAERLPEGLAKAEQVVWDENHVNDAGALRHRIDSVRKTAESRCRRIISEAGTRAEMGHRREQEATARRRRRPMPQAPKNLMGR